MLIVKVVLWANAVNNGLTPKNTHTSKGFSHIVCITSTFVGDGFLPYGVHICLPIKISFILKIDYGRDKDKYIFDLTCLNFLTIFYMHRNKVLSLDISANQTFHLFLLPSNL